MSRDYSEKRILGYCAGVLFLAVVAGWFVAGVGRAVPISIEVSEPEEARGLVITQAANEPNIIKLPGAEAGEQEVVEIVCLLIERGDFEEARQLIEKMGGLHEDWKLAAQLKEVIGQWEKLQQERRTGRKEAYEKELAELERLKSGKGIDVNDVNEGDVNDVNKPSGFSAVLAAVTRAREFADEGQRKELLSDPCVVWAIGRAKAEAREFESKGKWIDSYIVCYSWLTALEPNNKDYSEYADVLIEKAEIAGSFQDSSCETGRQRFEGVKKRIFVRAVDALNFNYISKIDYREMAAKGVRRCKSLADVIKVLTREGDTEPNELKMWESFKEFRPDANELEKLRKGLGSLEKEISEWGEGASKERFLFAFEKVLELNLISARLPEEVIIAQFAEASFATLDPYTVLVWPKQVEEFEKAMTNEFSGIGIEINRQKGELTVASLLPDTPAYNSGLDAGDVIESVDGMPTKDMSLTCAVKNITGPSGTKVTLTVRSEGEKEPRKITITRARITVPSIRGWQRNSDGEWLYMIDEKDKIGYVRLTSFSEKTAPDMQKALDKLDSEGMRGLILDLRFNSGGYFESAVEVADTFLRKGLIVITRPRFGLPVYTAAHRNGTQPDYPIVVLINSGSASASEIVAGALSDPSQERATLVGERTHGKGVVQGITHYPGEGAQLKYTMAYYHLPSGTRVKSKEEAEKDGSNEWGIKPDVSVGVRSDELRKMFELQRDNDVLVKAGHDNDLSPLKKHTAEETIEVDPQLDTAILVMKAKLIREQAKAIGRKSA